MSYPKNHLIFATEINITNEYVQRNVTNDGAHVIAISTGHFAQGMPPDGS